MQINSLSKTMLISQLQSANKTAGGASTILKDAMQAPEQFLQLLEQSISVQQTEKVADSIGFIIDRRV